MNAVPKKEEHYIEIEGETPIRMLDRAKQKYQSVLDSLIHGQNEHDRSDNEMLEIVANALEQMGTEEGKQKKNETIERMQQKTLESKERTWRNTNDTILILAGLALIGLKIWCDSNRE